MFTRAQKEEQVAELREKFARATTLIVADYRGIDVRSISELRGRLKAEESGAWEYRVTKNTLLRRAAEGSDVEAIADRFEGPTAIALSYGDSIGLAQILVAFAKEHELFEIKGGLLEGRVVDSDEIVKLATLPSLDELRAKIVGLVQAPAQKMVQVLSAPAAQLARVVDARRAKLEEFGGAS
jgi:large subunit ribosomal protein L10